MVRKYLWPVIGLLTVTGLAVSFAEEAADAAAKDAMAVVEQYILNLRGQDWEKCAGLMHPDALTDLKKMFVELAELAEKQGAEKTVLNLFEGVENVKAFKELEPQSFFVRFMKGLSRVSPQFKDNLAESTWEFVGAIKERGDLLHLVGRTSRMIGDSKTTKMAVESLKRHDGNWRLLLKGDFESMAATAKKRYTGHEKKTE